MVLGVFHRSNIFFNDFSTNLYIFPCLYRQANMFYAFKSKNIGKVFHLSTSY